MRRVDSSSEGLGVLAVVAIVLAVSGCGWISRSAQRRVEHATLVAKAARAFTPADAGIPFTRHWVELEGRKLEAWYVAAPDSVSAGAGVFIAHGTGETLSDWVKVQHLLRDNGIASFVFDYSGFGNSTGTPSALALEQDLIEAYAVFAKLLPGGTRRSVLGFSLGTGVLLATQHRLNPSPHAIVLASAFSSARSAAVKRRFFPGILAYLAPDSLWNNVEAVNRVKAPLLIVHSDADRTFPLSMARQLARVSGQRNSLLVQHGFAHNALYASASESQWRDIIAFLKQRPEM